MTLVEVIDLVRPKRPMSLAEQSAMTLAVSLHHNNEQYRRGTGEPYAVHLSDVVEVVDHYLHVVRDHDQLRQAAWLHDLIEDVGVSSAELRESFGPLVASIVHELTQPKSTGRPSKPRAERAAEEAERLSKTSWHTQSIKYADIMSNLEDFPVGEVEFAKIYFAEKQVQLNRMGAGDPELRRLAYGSLAAAKKRFGLPA